MFTSGSLRHVLFGGFTSLYCNNVLTEHTDNVILTNSINGLKTFGFSHFGVDGLKLLCFGILPTQTSSSWQGSSSVGEYLGVVMVPKLS